MLGADFKQKCSWLRAYMNSRNPEEVLRQVRVLSTDEDKPTFMFRVSNGNGSVNIDMGKCEVKNLDYCIEWNGVNSVARTCDKKDEIELKPLKTGVTINFGDSSMKLEANSSQGFGRDESWMSRPSDSHKAESIDDLDKTMEWNPDFVKSLSHSTMTKAADDPIFTTVTIRNGYAYTYRMKSMTRVVFPDIDPGKEMHLNNRDFQILKLANKANYSIFNEGIVVVNEFGWIRMPYVKLKSRHGSMLEKQCKKAIDEAQHKVTVNTKDLLSCMNRTAQATGQVHIRLTFESDKLTITAEDKNKAIKHRESVGCSSTVNASGVTRVEDLRSCLRAMRDETIQFLVPDLSAQPASFLTISDGSVTEIISMKPDELLTQEEIDNE